MSSNKTFDINHFFPTWHVPVQFEMTKIRGMNGIKANRYESRNYHKSFNFQFYSKVWKIRSNKIEGSFRKGKSHINELYSIILIYYRNKRTIYFFFFPSVYSEPSRFHIAYVFTFVATKTKVVHKFAHSTRGNINFPIRFNPFIGH